MLDTNKLCSTDRDLYTVNGRDLIGAENTWARYVARVAALGWALQQAAWKLPEVMPADVARREYASLWARRATNEPQALVQGLDDRRDFLECCQSFNLLWDDSEHSQLVRALQVLVLCPATRAWLTDNDPQALRQATKALVAVGAQQAPQAR